MSCLSWTVGVAFLTEGRPTCERIVGREGDSCVSEERCGLERRSLDVGEFCLYLSGSMLCICGEKHTWSAVLPATKHGITHWLSASSYDLDKFQLLKRQTLNRLKFLF